MGRWDISRGKPNRVAEMKQPSICSRGGGTILGCTVTGRALPLVGVLFPRFSSGSGGWHVQRSQGPSCTEDR